MTSTLRQKRSPLSPNEKLYNKINRKHSIPKEKVSSIKKSLKEGEEVDFDFSRIGGEYGSVYTKGADSRRLLFYKKEKDKMIFLYDAKSLIEDYEKLERFDKFDTTNPYVYLHLAIAYWREENDTEKCFCALSVFFRNSPDARGRYVLKTVEDNAWLFLISFEGFALLAQGYLKIGMLEEAAFTYTKFADCMYADENERRFFKSHAYLLLEQYEDAKAGFQKWVKKLEEQERDHVKSMLQKGKPPILTGFEFLNGLKYRYFWASGMAKWKEGNKSAASEAFQNAEKLAVKDSPERCLMGYLIRAANSGQHAESMIFQFSLLNKWRKEAGEKIDLPEETNALQVIVKEWKHIKECLLSQKEKIKVKGKEPREEKLEYEIWDIKGKRPASQKIVEDFKRKNKEGKVEVFINEDGTVYFNGNKVNELKKTQILYNFLLYFLKNKGIGGTYRELFINVWRKGEVSPSFEMDRYKKSSVIRMKNRLSTLLKNYSTKEIKYEYNKYRLDEDCNFCVIQKSIG